MKHLLTMCTYMCIVDNGEREEAIPRHTEINEKLARAILRRARGKT